MNSSFKTTFLIAFTTFLTACGGGGSSAPSQPVVSTDTYQFQVANANASQQTSTLSFSLTGSVNGVAVTGSGTLARSSLASTTFEGASALAQTTTVSGSFSANGKTLPLSTVSTAYMNSNYLPLGGSGSGYEVVNGTANIPSTIVVNDSGTVFVANRYTDSTKSTLLGTDTVTYALQPDTAHTALLLLTYVSRDINSVVTQTDTTTLRITPLGAVKYLSEVSATAGNVSLSMTFQ